MYFTTVQLRSADEGSTVFLTCVCGYKYACSHFPAWFDSKCLIATFSIPGRRKTTKLENLRYFIRIRICISMALQIEKASIAYFCSQKFIKQQTQQRGLLRPAPAHTQFPRSFHTQPCQEPP